VIGGIEQPAVAGIGREQYQRTNGYKTAVILGGAVPDVVDLVGEKETLSVEALFPKSAFNRFAAHRHSPSLWRNVPMELFTRLFGSLLVFVYHCFDRIVINGYLNGLSRPEQVVHFVREVLGIPVVSKEVLSQRTNDYQGWVEAYARNHKILIQWAEKGVRKEDYVLPALRRLVKKNAYGVYFIFSIPRRIPTTASWRIRGAASRTTTSTSGMRSWGRSSCVSHPFFRSMPPTGSTAIPSSNRS
jgi:hypothetical protein